MSVMKIKKIHYLCANAYGWKKQHTETAKQNISGFPPLKIFFSGNNSCKWWIKLWNEVRKRVKKLLLSIFPEDKNLQENWFATSRADFCYTTFLLLKVPWLHLGTLRSEEVVNFF